MEKNILEIKKLTKYYGDILGIKNVSLSLKNGEVFGFIGPNGSGKSTTIRTILNLINKSSGEVLINGKEFTGEISIKKMIGYLPSEVNLYEDLTVKEILDFHESFYDKKINKRRKELVKRFKIDETKIIEELSFGNRKKVGIILAFMHEPKLIILDEPTSGLDPIMQQVLFELIKEEKNNGNTIFYSTHILSEISKICDRVGIIKEGKLLNIETIEEMNNKKLLNVKIESKDIKNIIKELKLNEYINEEENLYFKTNISSDSLIKTLSKFKIDKILIEEPTLEEMFLHYYK